MVPRTLKNRSIQLAMDPGMVISTESTSLPNRFTTRPVGVVSKKFIGDLITPRRTCLCRVLLARTAPFHIIIILSHSFITKMPRIARKPSTRRRAETNWRIEPGMVMSIASRSLPNRLTTRPVGVVSKKLIGDIITPLRIFAWNIRDVRTIP